jgi:hypothetical protein
MAEENTTKSFTSTSAQKVEQGAVDRSVTNLKHVISSPQFMKLKEILQKNQSLIEHVDTAKKKENAGYKVLEEILNKGRQQ